MKPARIVVLVIAIAAGGIAALLAGRSNSPPPQAPFQLAQIDTVEVLVARRDIGTGHTVSAADVSWQSWPAASVGPQLMRRTNRADGIEQIAGSIARTPFSAGEPIREEKLIKANGSGYLAAMLPSGLRAVSTEVTPETGVAGFVLPNDRVDVILTRPTKTANGDVYTSETVLTNIKVLAIDQTVEEKSGERVVVGKIATLESTSEQAETIALARRLGTLSLALRSLRDGEDDPNARSRWKDQTNITVVRFGATSSIVQK